MLLDLYPKVHRRYTSLPIIGSTLDGYGTWLLKKGYSTDCVCDHFRAARRLARQLEQRHVRSLTLAVASLCTDRFARRPQPRSLGAPIG